MKNKNTLLKTTLSIALAGSIHIAHAFDLSGTSDILSFDPGVAASSYGSVTIGSYYGMDVNSDGVVSSRERIPISPGPSGGITLGALQPASGSHSGCPDGTESPGPDMPWCFFGITGMHQVTGTPVVANADGTFDFSGWGVTWNGIANIPLGSSPDSDSGLARVSCANMPCSPGDVRNLDYNAVVPSNDPSGFGGVRYTLHLANISQFQVTSIGRINFNVSGGNIQECNSTGGNMVSIQPDYAIPEGDALAGISWSVDNAVVSQSETLQQFMGLGSHRIEVSIITTNGLTGAAATDVLIEDTTAPEVIAAFIDKRRRVEVASVSNRAVVNIQAEAVDICDSNPVVSAVVGAPVENGDLVRANKRRGAVILNTSSLSLSVTASDASDNTGSASAVLNITN